MTSQARIAANRRNARRSSGPRTAAGKSSASRNAYRHGLAAITRHRPALFPEIERMATALCGEDKDPFLFEQARIIAENHLVLQCVRTERIARIERLRDRTASPLVPDTRLERAEAHFRMAKAQHKWLVAAKAANEGTKEVAKEAATNGAKTAAQTGPADRESAQESLQDGTQRKCPDDQQAAGIAPARESEPMELLDEFTAMRRATADLARLERYERRAWSRRKRAIHRFIRIKSGWGA